MHPLLFSIDLEEFYTADGGVASGATPLPRLVERYLALLATVGVRCTFFVVGEVARKYPAAIGSIVEAGHEIACHGDLHLTLDRLNPAELAADLRANRAALKAAGAPPPQGFRAPIFSLTATTGWVYGVLFDEGFTYSSSVLPGHNPLFGWPEFGPQPRRVEGVVELPITITRLFGHDLPIFGGTYFRVLPFPLVQPRLLAALRTGPVRTYFHPYDIDAAQPWSLHAGVRGSRALNRLLFLRRRSLPRRLLLLLRQTDRHVTYGEFARTAASIAG